MFSTLTMLGNTSPSPKPMPGLTADSQLYALHGSMRVSKSEAQRVRTSSAGPWAV